MKLISISSARSHLQRYLPDLSVIKHFLIYSSGALFLKVVSMLIVPLIMRTITPNDYGTLSLITSFITITTAIIGFGLRQVVSIEYFHCKTSSEKINLINEIIIIYLVTAVPTIMLLYYYQEWVIKYIFFGHITSLIFTTIIITIFLSFFVEFFYQILQYEQQSHKLIVLQTMATLISNGVALFFLWKLGIVAVVIGQLYGSITTMLIALYGYYNYGYIQHIILPPTLKKIPYYISYGFPFIPGILFSWVMASSDRWVLGYYTSMREVGIYSTADIFSQLFYFLILQPWAGSYLPYIMQQYKQNEDRDIYRIECNNQHVMFYCIGILFLSIGFGYSITPYFLKKILPLHYHEAIQYIWILLAGQIFLLGSYFCSALIQFKKKKWFLIMSLIFPALLNIVFNIILIPYFSITGAAIATLTSYFIYFMVTYHYNHLLLQVLKKDMHAKNKI